MSFKYIEEQIIKSDLCVHCGTCVGSCSNYVLEMDDVLGRCLPKLSGECKECGLCIEVCPGKDVNFSELAKSISAPNYHPMLGNYSKIYLGYTKNDSIRMSSASGGVVTTLLLSLLNSRKIDAAVILDFRENQPWFPQVKLTSSEYVIRKAAQSKYFVYPQNIILETIRNSPFSKIAYIGLPCQIHGLRKAIKNKVTGTEKIKYIFGLYCGNNLYFSATESLLGRFGIKDYKKIKLMRYREGRYPGNFVVHTKDGFNRSLDKFTFNYLSFFYIPYRCLFCIDQTNELADISFGDGWPGNFSEETKDGLSIVIVRNDKMINLFKNEKKESLFNLKEISVTQAISIHANVLDNKKRGAFGRINILKKFGYTSPCYYGNTFQISKTRYFFESVNLLVMKVFSNKIFRTLINIVPIWILRILMVNVRGYWRKISKKKYKQVGRITKV